jgi:hypothetical protein
VTDLQLQAPLGGQARQRCGFRAGRRHRFLDEHVDSVVEEEPGYLEMRRRARGDRYRVDAALEGAVVREELGPAICGYRSARLDVDVAHADQICGLQGVIFLGVEAA